MQGYPISFEAVGEALGASIPQIFVTARGLDGIEFHMIPSLLSSQLDFARQQCQLMTCKSYFYRVVQVVHTIQAYNRTFQFLIIKQRDANSCRTSSS